MEVKCCWTGKDRVDSSNWDRQCQVFQKLGWTVLAAVHRPNLIFPRPLYSYFNSFPKLSHALNRFPPFLTASAVVSRSNMDFIVAKPKVSTFLVPGLESLLTGPTLLSRVQFLNPLGPILATNSGPFPLRSNFHARMGDICDPRFHWVLLGAIATLTRPLIEAMSINCTLSTFKGS